MNVACIPRQASCQQPKVLLVDDQEYNLIALRRLLASVDAELLTARSGEEALGIALDEELALVLLDVQMPGMDGYEVAECLRASDRTEGIPILFLTAAFRDEAHRVKAYQAGAVDYLDKPINDTILLSKVRVFLDLYRHRREQEALLGEVRQLNACLLSSHRELEEKVRDLQCFSHTLSHDLRAPLRAINGMGAILEEEFAEALGPEGMRILATMRNSSTRMNRLLDDLLAFFRATAVPYTEQAVDLEDLAREAVAAALPRYAGSAVDIGPMPVVQGDRSALGLVFHNLIDNALKFSSRVRAPRVEVRSREEAGQVLCSVRDNGIGFEPRYSERLFNVFERLVDQREFEGTGVGLAIVNRVIQRHGGRVWAESEPGAGATFFCLLPRASEGSYEP